MNDKVDFSWTNAHEKNFIKRLGNHSSIAKPRLSLLIKYKKSLELRHFFGNLTKNEILTFVNREIKKLHLNQTTPPTQG